MARIAVNTRFLLKDKMEGFGWFTHEVVSRMVTEHPEHEFLFFFDRPFDPSFLYADNVFPVVLHPPARHPILFKIWFNVSVTRALKKYNADVFFSPDGYLSLKTDIPQVGVIHDLNFEHYPADLPASARKYLRTYFPKFAQKAADIITVSNYSANDIATTYGIDKKKIHVAWNGVSEEFTPLEGAPTGELGKGATYFLYVGALHPRKNIVRMLQAFDRFKENGSATRLVITGEPYWVNKEMKATFDSLRHKEDVVFTGHLSQDKLVIAMREARALVYVSYFEGFGIPLVEAMRSGIPVIAANVTSLPEVGGEVPLFVDPFKVDEIQEAMHLIDNDPELRQEKRKQGIERAQRFNWKHTADICWKVIEQHLPHA